MALNPKGWSGATPWSAKGKVAKSGPDKELKHNATRPLTPAATSMDHFQKVPKSGAGHSGLGNGGHENIGNPYAMSSDRSEMPTNSMGQPSKIDKSEPTVPKDHVKWHKRGYAGMDAVMGEAQAAAFNKRAKAK